MHCALSQLFKKNEQASSEKVLREVGPEALLRNTQIPHLKWVPSLAAQNTGLHNHKPR
eukprot:COSAG03_NODE_225_length_10336_cov_715.603888_10_plen_58_part_00